MVESPLIFQCAEATLVGILHRAGTDPDCGVVLVVGGPQYRVGSHRQFVLLARSLAAAGVPCLRFDYRGMGDSGGAFRGFEHIDEDMRAAVDTMAREQPTIRRFYLWGLCDAASAIAMYVESDARIAGVALCNPWMRSAQSQARTLVHHYYARRLISPAFWRKLFDGGVQLRQSLSGALRAWRAAHSGATDPEGGLGVGPLDFQTRMIDGLERFHGAILLVTSGDDLTAAEFLAWIRDDVRWQRRLGRGGVERRHLVEANHTFGRASWRRQVEEWTLQWLRQNPDAF